MKIELALILKQTNSKFFMKIIEIKDFKISKESISRTNQKVLSKEIIIIK
jgi:hypothetical protein